MIKRMIEINRRKLIFFNQKKNNINKNNSKPNNVKSNECESNKTNQQ